MQGSGSKRPRARECVGGYTAGWPCGAALSAPSDRGDTETAQLTAPGGRMGGLGHRMPCPGWFGG